MKKLGYAQQGLGRHPDGWKVFSDCGNDEENESVLDQVLPNETGCIEGEEASEHCYLALRVD